MPLKSTVYYRLHSVLKYLTTRVLKRSGMQVKSYVDNNEVQQMDKSIRKKFGE